MAADPKDLRPTSGDRPGAASAADPPTTSSSPKVKLLCSYGGKILPRPSDGALRYAGGDTRIITVRRDSTFPEIVRKIADAYGGPTLIRYQLPGEDLDNLISVSNPEDLENMMEESDKLAQDGSTPKLRVFLFPPSDLSANSSSSDLHDAALQYVEAVNGLNDSSGVRRKDSIASFSSMQAEAAADGLNEGISPALLSPTAGAPHDPSRLVFGSAGAPVAPILDVPGSSSAPCSRVQAQILNSSRSELPPPVAPYAPQGYVETQHAHIMNPQSLGTAGVPQPVNVLGVPAMHINMAPPTSQVNSTVPIQTRVDTNLEENPFGGRLAQLHRNPNYKPLSQLPPLPQVYLQPQNGEQYGLGPSLPSSQGQTVRLEDCNYCRKCLPHSHSDTHGKASGSAIPETGPMLQSHPAESMVRAQALPKVVTGAVAGSGVETQAESVVPAAQLGAYGFTQVPEIPRNHERLVLPNAANLSHAKVFVPAVSVGLPGNKQASYGMFTQSPQSHHEDFLQGQVPQSMGLPQYFVKQDVISKPFVADAGSVGKSSSQEAEHLVQDSVPVLSHDYVKAIDGMMEALHASPSEASSPPEQWKPVVPPAINVPNDLRSKNPMVVESSHLVKPQGGGNVMPISNALINSRIIPDGNIGIPVDPLPSTSSGFTHLHNVQLPNNNRVLTMTDDNGAYPYYLETGVGPVIPNKQLLGAPTYSNNFAYSDNTVHKIPSGHYKSEVLQFHPNEVPDDVSITVGNISQSLLSATSSHSGNEEQLEEKNSLDSLFCNEDPRKIVGNMHVLPPRPKRVPSKESVTMKDFCTENHSVNSKGSHVAIVIEEGGFDHPHDSLNKDLCMEPVQPPMTGDEHIKQDVGAFTEGVAASTPQSSEPPDPKESGPSFNKGSGTIKTNLNTNDHKSGVIKSKQSEKIFLGFPNADDIGRMQIIKNSDLEELKELGSGTFGTVYHGKWRGSDVAIKRINDRCFSGKPSEQERMRADFWNEACKLADLHHPNVVAFYGVVLDGPGGAVATVTEYMVSGSLRHALQKNDKPLDRRKRLLIAMDVAFGMEYLHSKKIIHFDLKSDNLLVNLRDPQRPICKVCDLGLSKVKCQTLVSGGVRGTLPWMAPELLSVSNSLVSEKVDVFSFGIVMWELLTGEEPYADLHYGAIIGGIVSNTLRPPVPESCDPDWRSLMEQCWSAEASDRPIFTEIASRLRSMAASLPPDQAAHPQHSRQRHTND